AAFFARTGDAVIGLGLEFGEIGAAAARRSLSDRKSGARRRIDLAAMMRLEDFDVPVSSQPRRRLLDQAEEQIDAERKVAVAHDGDAFGVRGDLRLLLARKTGGADDGGFDRRRLKSLEG